MANGLRAKYRLTKFDGRSVDPGGIYFILKLNSLHKDHARASQEAALAYANEIEGTIPELARDLRMVVQELRGGGYSPSWPTLVALDRK